MWAGKHWWSISWCFRPGITPFEHPCESKDLSCFPTVALIIADLCVSTEVLQRHCMSIDIGNRHFQAIKNWACSLQTWYFPYVTGRSTLHFTLFLHAPSHFQSEITSLHELHLLHLFSKVEEMVKEVYDWESELQRLVQVDGINSASKGVPEMVVEDGPLISFNAYDRRYGASGLYAGACCCSGGPCILFLVSPVCGLELSTSGPLVNCNSKVWSFCVWSGQDRLLAGAIIAERIRSAVRMELGYTCSVVDMRHSLAFPLTCVEACLLLSLPFLFSILVWLWVLMGWQGIATNKLLAKIASAKNKPDRQTLVGCRPSTCSFPQSYVQLASILCGICKSLLYLEVGSNCSNALFVMLWSLFRVMVLYTKTDHLGAQKIILLSCTCLIRVE